MVLVDVPRQPWFVIPWYLVGAVGANRAVKGAWPVIVFFLSELHVYAYMGATVVDRLGRVVGEVDGFTEMP